MSALRQVAIVGAGKTPFGAFPDKDLRALAVAAGEKALQNANMEPGRDRKPFISATSPARNSPARTISRLIFRRRSG